jgi:AraC-like DNA-binding protein
MSWVQTVLSAAARQGVAQDALLQAAEIPLQDLQLQRWPVDHITRLWRSAAALTQDPGFGLKAGATVSPASFNVLGYILQSAPTLRAAMEVVQKFQRLISDAARFQMVQGPAASWVVYHPHQGNLPFSPYQQEAVVSAAITFSRWVTSTNANPRRVQFSHAAVGPLETYRAVFGCPVEFEQAFSGLLLDNDLLDKPLPQADAHLTAMHREYAANQLEALSHAGDFSEQVRNWIVANMSHGVPARSDAAKQFSLSNRVFARRLQEQGVNYSNLIDSVRQEAARLAVADTGQAFVDIASRLGFSEASAFSRAFKRWTGHSPSEWRHR